MDFEQLKTFQLVSRLKSFSKAAEKLSVTQPAISAQIRSLENEVGARLFDREGGKVTFTAAGRLFEPFAEHCLQCHSHILAGVSELYHSPRGEISVSTSEATSLYVLPAVLGLFTSTSTPATRSFLLALGTAMLPLCFTGAEPVTRLAAAAAASLASVAALGWFLTSAPVTRVGER